MIFSLNRSFLLRKRMMEVSMKNLLLQMESKSIRDSCMRFYGRAYIGKEKDRDRQRTKERGRERERERNLGLGKENCYQMNNWEMVEEPWQQKTQNSCRSIKQIR